MLPNHLILCCPLLLPPSIFPSIRLFSSLPVLHIGSPNYWAFSFNISPSKKYSGLIYSNMNVYQKQTKKLSTWKGWRGTLYQHYVNSRPFHFNVWQNSLQIKKNKNKNKKKKKNIIRQGEQNLNNCPCVYDVVLFIHGDFGYFGKMKPETEILVVHIFFSLAFDLLSRCFTVKLIL